MLLLLILLPRRRRPCLVLVRLGPRLQVLEVEGRAVLPAVVVALFGCRLLCCRGWTAIALVGVADGVRQVVALTFSKCRMLLPTLASALRVINTS